MNTTDLVHFRFAEAPTHPVARRQALVPSRHELAAPVRNCIFCSRQFLVGRQRLDGSWAGERSDDVDSLSQLVLLHAFLGGERSEVVEQAARAIRRDQRGEGGWALTSGGPIDQGASVLAYFALKFAGDDPSHASLRRAREAIRAGGGADAAGPATRFWLALLGQIDYDSCPTIAPEQLLMPAGPMSGTADEKLRLAALSVISALRPVRKLEFTSGIRELFILPPKNWPTPIEAKSPRRLAALQRLWSWGECIGWLPFRRRALERAKMLLTDAIYADRGETSIGELAWRRVALSTLGFAESSPTIEACEHQLQRLVVVDAELDEARARPETSLTADTALAIEALHASGLSAGHSAVSAGVDWLLEHRMPMTRACRSSRELTSILRMLVCLNAGDDRAASILPPDIKLIDDGRARDAHDSSAVRRQCIEDLCRRVFAEQRPDGGWPASSVMSADPRRCGAIRAVDRQPTTESSPSATGAILDMMCSLGQSPTAEIRRALDYLQFAQRADGSWHDATDARFVEGTAWAIRGLISAGATPDDPSVAAGVNWLLIHQLESGCWGEAVASAIQTAWAVSALVAAGQADHDATRRAIGFLARAQQDDGAWSDSYPTEHDFATGGWYRNDLHATALPTMALASWAVSIAAQPHARPVSLRLVAAEAVF